MSLEDLRERLAELRRRRAGAPKSLKSVVARQTKCPMSKIYVPDKHLSLVPEEAFKAFLVTDKTNEAKYSVDWNCDDFARNLYNNVRNWGLKEKNANYAFALVWTQRHALNGYAREPDGRFIFLEPQTDKKTQIHSRPVFILF